MTPQFFSFSTAPVANTISNIWTSHPTTPFPMPSLKDFDPNAKPHSMPEWATFSPGRHPEWKIHTRRGDAKNAFNWCRIGEHYGIILYHWENGMWFEKCRQEGDLPERCQECDKNLIEETRVHLFTRERVDRHHRGHIIWDPRHEWKRITVCRNCKTMLT